MSTGKRAPAAPATLGAAGKRLWRTLVQQYNWTAAQLEVVELLARTRDRIAEADAALSRDGAFLRSDRGIVVRQHPACRVLKDCQTTFVSLWKSLNLDLSSMPEAEVKHGI